MNYPTEHPIKGSKQKFSTETGINHLGFTRGSFLEALMPSEDLPSGASVTEGSWAENTLLYFSFTLTISALTTLLIPGVWVFHASSNSPRHRLGVQ